MKVCGISFPLGDILMKKSHRQFAMITIAFGIPFFVVFLAIATRESASAIPRPKGAVLTLCATTHDLGQTSLREELHVSFPICNSGTRRLMLNALDLDCGCGEPTQGAIFVAPGETIHVDVPLDTRFVTGSVENSLEFTTNDPANTLFQLRVRVFVAVEGEPM